MAPHDTSKPILDKLHAALAKTMQLGPVRDALAAQGAEAVTQSPDAFRAFLRQELARTATAVKAAGLQPE